MQRGRSGDLRPRKPCMVHGTCSPLDNASDGGQPGRRQWHRRPAGEGQRGRRQNIEFLAAVFLAGLAVQVIPEQPEDWQARLFSSSKSIEIEKGGNILKYMYRKCPSSRSDPGTRTEQNLARRSAKKGTEGWLGRMKY